MFEFQAPLCFGILFAILGSLFCLILLLSLIHFERNHHFRTLIDQLITSMYWYGILWIFTLQVPTTIRYIVGPFPTFVCAVDVIYKNVFTMQVLFFFDFIILSRYIFIFHLKNPTALQEDFWKIFINIFTISFSIISQIVIFFISVKHPTVYYVCLGYYPKSIIHLKTKINPPIVFHFLFIFALFIFSSIRIKIHKNRQKEKKFMQSCINNQALENYAINVIHLFLMVMAFSSSVVASGVSIDKLEVLENYIFMYNQHHFLPMFMLGTMLILNYAQNKPLRRFLFAEFLPDLQSFLRFRF